MKRLQLRTAMILAATLLVGLETTMAQAETGSAAPQEEITIKGKKPARFNHTIHLDLGLSCATCHHDADHKPRTAEDIGALTDTAELRCVNCHNRDFADPKLRKAKSVFHARCRTCHAEGYQGKKGPKKCNACHLKKRKAYEGC